MRILVVAASPPWPMTDGASLVLNHQLRHLAPRHEITVLAAGRPPGEPQPSNHSVGVAESVSIRWFGATGHRVAAYVRRRLAGVRAGEPADVFSIELPRLVAAFDEELDRGVDLVHLHGWGTARLARRTTSPAVHMVIDAWQRGYGEQRALPTWRRVIEVDQRNAVVRHERRHYPRCGAVVVVAPKDAEVLRDACPDARVETVPNGVDTDIPVSAPATQPILGFHGVLSTVANADAARRLVIEILPRVKRRHPGARVLLIGRDPGRELLELAGADVEVTGPVPDVRAELCRAAIYVAPLSKGSGIKNKVLEAMSIGLPVVSTPMAVDGIGCTGGIMTRDGAVPVADAVADLLDDRSERARLGGLARACAEQLDWGAHADALDALWHEVARADPVTRSR